MGGPGPELPFPEKQKIPQIKPFLPFNPFGFLGHWIYFPPASGGQFGGWNFPGLLKPLQFGSWGCPIIRI